ncbi:MAG: hypothetical protein ACI8Y4_004319, partial [Candidatus Poriferisodalaceae bacterium]
PVSSTAHASSSTVRTFPVVVFVSLARELRALAGESVYAELARRLTSNS